MLLVSSYVGTWSSVAFAVGLAQLCVLEPEALRARYPDGCIWGSMATFAAPTHGDRIFGRVRWAGHEGCDDDVTSLSSSGAAAVNSDRRRAATRYVEVLWRGRCSFAHKARQAQRAGADALVVVDFNDSRSQFTEGRRVTVAGDGGIGVGLVPTLLADHEDMSPLVALVAAGENVAVELRWDLPSAVARLDLWLPPRSQEGLELLQGLAPVALALRDLLLVWPHYRVTELPATTPAEILERDCLGAHRQFCIEGGSNGSVLGTELLGEVQRQHCIRALHAGRHAGTFLSGPWWRYVEALPSECSRQAMADTQVRESASSIDASLGCSRRAMAAVGIDATDVESCAAERGLVFLEDDREARAWGDASQVAIRINDWRYSGLVDSESVLRAMCRVFVDPPKACAPFLPLPANSLDAGELWVPAWALVGLCILSGLACVFLCKCASAFSLCLQRRWCLHA